MFRLSYNKLRFKRGRYKYKFSSIKAQKAEIDKWFEEAERVDEEEDKKYCKEKMPSLIN
jgi:hypothetical protein